MSPLSRNQNLEAKTPSYTPVAVIIGKTDSGTSILYNMLCGINHKIESTQESPTQHLFRNPVNCGSHSFELIDTSTIDSEVDTYKHALLLKEALTNTTVNTIFCILKYDNRFRNIISEYEELVVPVAKYANQIVIMISHADLSASPMTDFEQICAYFDEESCKIANIIFYSEQDSPLKVAHLMYCCVCNMEHVTLSMNDEEFHSNFSIYQMQHRIGKFLEEQLQEIQKKKEEYIKFIGSVESQCQSVEDKDGILHMIMVKFKEEMENLSDEFIKVHGKAMQELDRYGFHIEMRKEILKTCDEISEKASAKMSYSLLDSTDPRNLIKKCPNCGEIWFKTEGCDGATTCGNNSFSNYYDVSQKPSWRFRLEQSDGVFCWSKEVQSDKRQLPQRTRTSDDRRKGCGASFEWAKLPPIEEHTIKELFQVKTTEDAKKFIRN